MNNNGQSAASNLSNEQIQVILTGKFGDGCFAVNGRAKYHPEWNFNIRYQTNSINKDYLEFKKSLLGDLVTSDIKSVYNSGYKKSIIYTLVTKCDSEITKLSQLNIEESLKLMDELGLALWFYDDGSLHKTKEFYNLNTHAFSKEVQEDVIIPFLKNKFNISAKLTKEVKQDGRIFWYLRIGKFDGAFIIANILSKYYIESYNYKIISSETIQRWSKLQEQLKSEDISTLTSRQLSCKLRKIEI